VLDAWSEIVPEQAATFVSAQLEGVEQERAVAKVASAWAETDPRSVLTWIDSLQAGPIRERAVREIVSTWAGRDAASTESWLMNQPLGAGRDSAVEAYVRSIQYSNPSTAFVWAQSIADVGTRLRAVEMVADMWLAKDAKAAAETIQASTLPPEVRAKLLEEFQPPE
jgi:hypothetical protein